MSASPVGGGGMSKALLLQHLIFLEIRSSRAQMGSDCPTSPILSLRGESELTGGWNKSLAVLCPQKKSILEIKFFKHA